MIYTTTLQVIQRNENKSVPRGPVRFVKLQNQTKFPVMDGYLTLYIDSSISSNLRSYIYILLTVNFVTVSTLGVPKFRVKNQKLEIGNVCNGTKLYGPNDE